MLTVKNTLILPALFLFYFLLILLILTGLDLLLALQISPPQAKVVTYLSERIPASLSGSLLASCTGGLLALFFTMTKRPGSRIVSFLLVLATVSSVLVLGRYGLARVASSRTEVPSVSLSAGKFAEFENRTLYSEVISETELRRTVVFSDGQEGWKLRYIPRAAALYRDGGIEIQPEDAEALNLRPAIDRKETPPLGESLVPLFREYRRLDAELSDLLETRFIEFLLLSVSIAFVLLASQLFMRISRWPLFNIVLVLFLVRGVLFLYSAMRKGYFGSLQDLVPQGLFERILPSLVFLGLGILMFLADIIFIPYDYWQRKVDMIEGAGP
jgi:hypothetical protein